MLMRSLFRLILCGLALTVAIPLSGQESGTARYYFIILHNCDGRYVSNVVEVPNARWDASIDIRHKGMLAWREEMRGRDLGCVGLQGYHAIWYETRERAEAERKKALDESDRPPAFIKVRSFTFVYRDD
jgi:hypothetical protein